jgi:hypothetical protein
MWIWNSRPLMDLLVLVRQHHQFDRELQDLILQELRDLWRDRWVK